MVCYKKTFRLINVCVTEYPVSRGGPLQDSLVLSALEEKEPRGRDDVALIIGLQQCDYS